MKISFIFIQMIFLHFTKSADIDSYEINRIEFTPLHDAIIYNDIADIMNELENNMKPQLGTRLFSGSASEEDSEDLLSEYLHYLDKAHQQRINYEEKTKNKNKVPLLRFEKFSKMKPSSRNNYNGAHNNFINKMKYSESSFLNPLRLFIPHNSVVNTGSKLSKLPSIKTRPQDYGKELPNLSQETASLNVPTFSRSINIPMSPSCYCKTNERSCKCNDFIKSMNRFDDKQNIFIETYPKNLIYTSEGKPPHNTVANDKLNIRIKIDVQYPEIIEPHNLNKYKKLDKDAETNGTPLKQMVTSINLPFPLLNFPIPIELLGYNSNINKHAGYFHKMAIHKKKKSHINNKKLASKKIITFHSINLNPLSEQNNTVENHNLIKNNNSSFNKKNEDTAMQINTTENIIAITDNADRVHNNTVPLSKTISNSSSNIYVPENTLRKSENYSDHLPKIENSIETDLEEKNNNTIVLRLKREQPLQDIQHLDQSTLNDTKETKKYDKSPVGEIELLYWPVDTKNQTPVQSKNITALILERESKKTKLNMSSESLRNNRTMALERAIFGDVDWNDVDSVAPVFMSFVGKYIRGVLTFCSPSVCHSMKCAEKICIHRSCPPDNRYNHKGHCSGNNHTDSLAGMESIMDLPSNIAFEIVDILQDKMLGKMFGKATLCITSKCITFIASKKLFQRSKCISKELSSSGHCPNVKNVKIV